MAEIADDTKNSYRSLVRAFNKRFCSPHEIYDRIAIISKKTFLLAEQGRYILRSDEPDNPVILNVEYSGNPLPILSAYSRQSELAAITLDFSVDEIIFANSDIVDLFPESYVVEYGFHPVNVFPFFNPKLDINGKLYDIRTRPKSENIVQDFFRSRKYYS